MFNGANEKLKGKRPLTYLLSVGHDSYLFPATKLIKIILKSK